MTEALKDLSPLLGVILTFIAGVFAYRAQERSRDKEFKSAGRSGTAMAMAGVLAERDIVHAQTEAMQCLSGAILKHCDMLQDVCNTFLKRDRDSRVHDAAEAALDEIAKVRRALEDIAAQSAQIRRDRMRQDSSD